MLAGYGLGLTEPGAMSLEPGVLASVVILGALVAASVEVPLSAGMALIAGFGLCHGFSHGAEAPGGGGLGFPAGFAAATLALHGLGLALGLGAQRMGRPVLLRLIGGGVALGGVALAIMSLSA
jgi:urease accessory protein